MQLFSAFPTRRPPCNGRKAERAEQGLAGVGDGEKQQAAAAWGRPFQKAQEQVPKARRPH